MTSGRKRPLQGQMMEHSLLISNLLIQVERPWNGYRHLELYYGVSGSGAVREHRLLDA